MDLLQQMRERLRQGDALEVTTGGGTFEVWAEIYANPPTVYYQGEPHPISELDDIIKEIVEGVGRGEYRCRWISADDD